MGAGPFGSRLGLVVSLLSRRNALDPCRQSFNAVRGKTSVRDLCRDLLWPDAAAKPAFDDIYLAVVVLLASPRYRFVAIVASVYLSSRETYAVARLLLFVKSRLLNYRRLIQHFYARYRCALYVNETQNAHRRAE